MSKHKIGQESTVCKWPFQKPGHSMLSNRLTTRQLRSKSLGRGWRDFTFKDLQVCLRDRVIVPEDAHGTLKPVPGSNIIAHLEVVPTEMCGCIKPVGIQAISLLEVPLGLPIAFQPIQAHAITD